MAQPNQGKCRSCEAPIYWAHIKKKDGSPGKMPFDVEPTPDGTHKLTMREGINGKTGDPEMQVYATWIPAKEREAFQAEGGKLRLSHFATCPNADQHRGGT